MGAAAIVPIVVGAASSFAAAKASGADTSDALKMGVLGGVTGGIVGMATGALGGTLGGTLGSTGGQVAGALGSSLASNAFGVSGATPGTAATPWSAWGAQAATPQAISTPNAPAPGGMSPAQPQPQVPMALGDPKSKGLPDWLTPENAQKFIGMAGNIADYSQKRKDAEEAMERERQRLAIEAMHYGYRPPPNPQLISASPGQYQGVGGGFSYGRG